MKAKINVKRLSVFSIILCTIIIIIFLIITNMLKESKCYTFKRFYAIITNFLNKEQYCKSLRTEDFGSKSKIKIRILLFKKVLQMDLV